VIALGRLGWSLRRIEDTTLSGLAMGESLVPPAIVTVPSGAQIDRRGEIVTCSAHGRVLASCQMPGGSRP
jgi:hypothetical protein